MDNKAVVSAILDGADIKKVLEKPGLNEETAYDSKWEDQVWSAAKDVFSDSKKLWDLMAFAPDKYNTDALQDSLNAFNDWYRSFFKIKEVH